MVSKIACLSPYEVMVARYGKRRAEMEFRVSATGPVTTRALKLVVMDHTPSDIVIVDDNSMLPWAVRPLTRRSNEHSAVPVMRCLKHAILPKAYVPRHFPSVKNRWECAGIVPSVEIGRRRSHLIASIK
jgi:putative transposase